MKPNSPPENPFEAKWAILAGTTRKRISRRQPSTPRGKPNTFIDRRLGEDNPSVPEEDRYLARLQRERSRRTRAHLRFSLADAQEQGLDAPDGAPAHSLLRDDYDDAEGEREGPEAGEEGVAAGEEEDPFIRLKASVEGEDREGNATRTHREIMDEVMLKSKMHKAQRQQEKHAVDEETAKLDQDLPDIMAMLAKSGNDYAAEKVELKNSKLKQGDGNIFADEPEAEALTSKPPGSGVDDPAFHYSRVYQQLAAEKRARPSNRLLTEEENAENEMEELQQLEEKRKRRMQNAESEDEDERPKGRAKPRKKSTKKGKKADDRRGGDDLDDGFHLPETSNQSDSEDSDASDPEDSSKQHSGANSGANATKHDRRLKPKMSISKEPKMFDSNTMIFPKPFVAKVADSDIPYIYKECPVKTTHLQNLFEERTVRQRSLVLERLRKCFAVSLSPSSNPAKLQGLLECILRRIEILTRVASEHFEAAVMEVDMLLTHAHALGKGNEDIVGSWARDHIAKAFSSLTNADNLECGLSGLWKVSILFLLRCIGRLFPASDMRHPVSTPLAVLLSEGLELSRMKETKDVAVAILVGNILMEQMAESGRYSGQLTTLLVAVVEAMHEERGSVLEGTMRELREHNKAAGAQSCLEKLTASDCMRTAQTTDEKRALQGKIGHAAMRMIEASGFSGRVKHLDIIYTGLPTRLVTDAEARDGLEEQIAGCQDSRKGLRLYARVGAPVGRGLNPKVSSEGGVFRRQARTSYVARRDGDLSASAARVRRALRKEERGLAREVRQGCLQMGHVRAKADMERRERQEKRGRETMAFLEGQQANWKKAEKRQKMLSGKKW